MAKLTVIILEKATPSLRGTLTKWMLELRAGVFIGTLSALVRQKLWEKVCEKNPEGGAFLIHTMNNEQNFEIHSSGNTGRTIVDFDGIKLIKIHTKKRNNKSKKQKVHEKNQNNTIPHEPTALTEKKPPFISKSPEFAHFTPETFPKEYIWRKVEANKTKNKTTFKYHAISSFPEINHESAWNNKWKDDLENICEKILSTLQNTKPQNEKISNKKIISIDIETTDYIPKAFEGFVNILGIAIINTKNNQNKKTSISIHQVFNMTRKKERAVHLLNLLKNEIENSDTCLVFNKKFDITILNKIIKDNNLNINLPKNIIDLNQNFRSLADLEEKLNTQTKFSRKQTQKSKFTDYYKLFKGEGRKGKNKKIEPIGSYNIIDTLTP
ncbi:MAG: type I-E CRISPR-associated endoribonuclease Cas2, partial [Deltaproteobacteria bacterium]|nr:type I-E CRISPR-associated endoribonuclease Cas2 [Deltaproteobacteria bacterium]